MELIRPYQQELGLDGVGAGEYPEQLNMPLESHDHNQRKTASAVAGEYGRRLGWLAASTDCQSSQVYMLQAAAS